MIYLLSVFAPFPRLVGQDVALDDAGVFTDLDAALPRIGKGLPVAVLGEKAPDVLPLSPQRTVGQAIKKNMLVVLPIHESPDLMGKIPFAKTFLLLISDIVLLAGNLVLES